MTDNDLWYSARILMEASHPDGHSEPKLFEDSVVLLRAGSIEEAATKATRQGKKAEHSYKNAEGETVRWEFREVLDVVEVLDAELVEGSEVYHHYIDEEGVEYLRRALKASLIN